MDDLRDTDFSAYVEGRKEIIYVVLSITHTDFYVQISSDLNSCLVVSFFS